MPDVTGDQAAHEELTPKERQGLAQGIGARIMPSAQGWRVDYFSIADWESEPGTLFPSFVDALDAVAAVLPKVNSPEQRARAHKATDLSL